MQTRDRLGRHRKRMEAAFIAHARAAYLKAAPKTIVAMWARAHSFRIAAKIGRRRGPIK